MKYRVFEYLIGLVNIAWLTSVFTADFTQKVILIILQLIMTFATRKGFDVYKKRKERRKNEILTNNIRANKKDS